MASKYTSIPIVFDPNVPHGTVIGISGNPARWSPAYKDWGFDEIYPAAPDPFKQVEAWDREHRGRWIEPAELHGLATFAAVLQQEWNGAIKDMMKATSRPFWTSTIVPTTYSATMARDMKLYADTTDPLRVARRRVKRLRTMRRDWRRLLANRIYNMEECY